MANREVMGKSKDSLGAMLAGIAVGAAMVFLAKKENRDKVKEKASELKDKGKDKLDRLNRTIQKEKEVAKEALDKGKEVMNEEMGGESPGEPY